MKRQKILRQAFSCAVILTAIGISPAFPNIYPPKPTQYFYGDADGNTAINASDLSVLRSLLNGKAFTFDTLQPKNLDQAWNTCDLDGDRACTPIDINILRNYINGKPGGVKGKTWHLEIENLPSSDNYPTIWIPFNANIYSYDPDPFVGASGRPGISVVAKIAPIGSGSTVTGKLTGRECNPVNGSRDQAAQPGAQCALAVTQTDWNAAPAEGKTESGNYGLKVWADDGGTLRINLSVSPDGLNVPALSINVDVQFKAQEGLALAGSGNGPMVIFDTLTLPLPDIPFPSDILTIPDGATATGRRFNVDTSADTQLETKIREKINTLDGFGTFAPITVRFNSALDLSTATDANILVIKLLSPNAGDVVPLDLGKGFFPTITRPQSYWPNDPLKNANNILMDPNNVADLNGDTVPEFIDHYEFATNTLIIRPIVPLKEASRYAVVLLKGLKGANGDPVRSWGEYINHTMQTEDLAPLVDLLQGRGISLDEVAYCWSFTTQSISPDWINFWNGLHNGTGPLGYLANAFPPVLTPQNLQIAVDMDGNPYTVKADWFGPILSMLFKMGGQSGYLASMDFRWIDYFVFATFRTPTFFDDLGFGNPLITDERYFDPAKLSGATPAGELQATVMIAVPKGEDLGLDYCQAPDHPYGCKDSEENGAMGPDGCWGICGVDSNGDGMPNDEGEYLTSGSDDVPDPACDNYYPNIADFPQHCKDLCFVGGVPVPDWTTGACTQTQGNGQLDILTDGGGNIIITEDANGNGKLDTPPFPVILYGHGLTNGAMESIAFVSPNARNGFATVAMDAFGHGPMDDLARMSSTIKSYLSGQGISLSEVCHKSNLSSNCSSMLDLITALGADLNGDKQITADDVDGKSISQIVDATCKYGLYRVMTTLGRAYDIDGDGYTDSGKVFFSGNIFQTRDAVRQTAIDYMQLSRIVDNFGSRHTLDFNGDAVPDLDGDFNADGSVDLGGPPTTENPWLYYMGSSLGGINGNVMMGVNPRVVVGAPVSGAGGLVNVISRSNELIATQPALSQTLGPNVVGRYNGTAGKATLTFDNDPLSQSFGTLKLPSKGRVQVTNTINGRVATVTSDASGNFAVAIPADVGDSIQVLSLDDSGSPKSTVNVNSKYHGLGLNRNTPDFRRFLGLAQIAIERGDPVNLAPHFFTNDRGAPYPGYPEKSVLLITTDGDNTVPVATGSALDSSSGLWSLDLAQKLINNTLNLGYIPESGYSSPIYDPEDLDDDGLKCGFPASDHRCNPADPGLAPAPAVPVAGGARFGAARFEYVSESGHHAFALPATTNHGIDWGVYMLNQIGYFFASGGTCIIDDPWELHSAPMITPGPNGVLDTVPSGDDKIHTIRILSTLGAHPCNYSFPTIQVITTGPNFTIDSTPAGDDVLINYSNLYRGP